MKIQTAFRTMLLGAALLIFAGFALVSRPAAGDLTEHYSAARDATYKVTSDERPGHGTGVLVAPNYLLTAYHVVDGREKLAVWQGGDRLGPAKLLYGSEEMDVAVLWVPLACPCVPLAKRDLFEDEPAFTVGYPIGLAQVLTTGTAQGLTRKFSDMVFVVVTAHVAPGNSGGGLFSTVNGKLRVFGVVLAMPGINFYQRSESLSLFSPLASITKVMACVTPGQNDAAWCNTGDENAETH